MTTGDRVVTNGNLSRQGGFTLTEMMVALVLGAIIVTPFYVITRGISEETTHQQLETEAMQRSRVGLETLLSDFQRAGMMVSPNPANDTESIVSSNTSGNTQLAYDRQAVVHLNRDGTDPFDSIILVGSFVSANAYTAYVNTAGADTVSINEAFANGEDCEDEFNPNYAFMHLYTSNGQTLDAKVSSVTANCSGTDQTNCLCDVTLEPGELFVGGPGGFAEGQLVNVAANQAAFYRVETVSQPDGGAHKALMRYFIDYNSTRNLGASCAMSDIDDDMISDMMTSPKATAKMIADYVEEFEVWFRPVYKEDSTNATEPPKPANHSFGDVSADIGFAPPADTHLLGIDHPDSYDAMMNDLSCEAVPGRIGPEHIRSTMIRLAVRTERTDMSMRITALDETDPAAVWDTVTGVTKYNVARGPDGDVGAYKLRTVITEVPLPNLASKMFSFGDVPNW